MESSQHGWKELSLHIWVCEGPCLPPEVAQLAPACSWALGCALSLCQQRLSFPSTWNWDCSMWVCCASARVSSSAEGRRSAGDQGCAVSSAYLFCLNCLPFCSVSSLLPVSCEGWLCNSVLLGQGVSQQVLLVQDPPACDTGTSVCKGLWSLWNQSTICILKHERTTQAQKMDRKSAFLY